MKKENAILLSKVDREDGWVSGGLVFKVENTSTYEDSYNEIKKVLETDEIINYIIESRHLLDDLFDGDETYKFINTRWKGNLYFIFRNDNEEEVEYKMSADYVFVN
jgi:hypothetical protein